MTTSSTNYTSLYSGNVSGAVPNTAYGNANVVSLLAASTDGANTIGNISATGNVAGNYFLGNGSQLTGIAGSYGNANVTTLLAAFGSNTVSTTGNVTAGNILTPGVISATGNITTAGFFIGTFAGNISGNLTVPGSNTQVIYNNSGNAGASAGFTFNQASNVATVSGNIVGGNITTAGNVTGNYILGNGSQLTGLPATYGNANVVANLAALGSNPVSTTGNVSAGYFLGNGSQLTGIAASYGNANVTTLLASFGSNTISTTGTIVAGNVTGGNVLTGGIVSATGNVTGNYILGNGSQLTGLPATYGNANVVSLLAAFGSNAISTTGNVTAGYVIGNGSLLTNITGANVSGQVANALVAGTVYTAAQPNITSVGTLTSVAVTGNVTGGNILTAGAVSATGNITGNYIIGNGSQLTGLPAGYSNADVATFLAAFGSNAISTTGNVTAGYFSGNGSLLTNLTAGNITGQVANALIAGTVYTNAQPNITSVGTLTSVTVTGNITGGNILTGGAVSATGDITSGSGVFYGNGAGLTNINAGNIVGAYGNANVANFLGNYGSNTISTTGNISAGNLRSSGTVSSTGNVIVGGTGLSIGTVNFFNNSGAPSGLICDAATAAFSGAVAVTLAVSAAGNVTGGNVLTGGILSATGNITGGNLAVGGVVSATGDIFTTGNLTVGNSGKINFGTTGSNVYLTNGSPTTLAINAAQTDIGGNLNVGAGYITASGNVTGGNILTGGVVSATGNITGNYIIGNGSQLSGLPGQTAGSDQQIQYNNAGAFAGNAALTFNQSTGNVTLSNVIIGKGDGTAAGGNTGQQINTSNAFVGGSLTNIGQLPGQITIGNGFFGNLNLNNIQARPYAKFQVWDSANVTEVGGNSLRHQAGYFGSQLSMGNIANTGTLLRGAATVLGIGGGPSANVWTPTNNGMFAVLALNQFLAVGQPNTVAALGNVTLTGAAAAGAQHFIYAGSNVGNAGAVLGQISAAGNVTNAIGFQINYAGTPATTPTNTIGYYMPGTTTSFGSTNSNGFRQATNYYFLRNDDAVAQSQLGSLRAYHTFQAGGNTTGTWDINKDNGQVQAVSATGNITIGSYTNFVTTANDGTNNDSQTDTVTLIIEQGATPYTVTMPTGNAAIRYASNVTTVANTANSTTMVAITAYRTAANATGYLTTISPGFV